MSHFPKEKVRGRCKLNIFTCKVVKSPIWCFCKMPQCIGNMICCEIANVKHGLDLDSVANEWRCLSCERQNQWAVANCFKLSFFFQTIRCWLPNSLFSPNDLRHTLFKFLIPNILNAILRSKEHVNQNVSPACEPGIFITRNRRENYINSICF